MRTNNVPILSIAKERKQINILQLDIVIKHKINRTVFNTIFFILSIFFNIFKYLLCIINIYITNILNFIFNNNNNNL